MNSIATKCLLFRNAIWNSVRISQVNSFSLSCPALTVRHRRRWVTSKEWKKNFVDDENWAPNVPMEHNINPWTRRNAYFGTYDFMDILGNDVTLEPKLLCKGPTYMRGKRLNELQMLIKRRRKFGSVMHIEDLHITNKRIKYLLKVYNRIKGRTRG